MTIKVLFNYILTRLGIREMLPGEILRYKPIKECNEPLVSITPCDGLFLAEGTTFCRTSVAEKLTRVAKELHKRGLGLYIYELYRSPQQQQARIEASYLQLQNSFSDKEELEKYVRRCTAGVGGGHQTGGAVDLTLCDKNGYPIEMGSQYPVKCQAMVTSYRINPEIDNRRRLLCSVMRKEGFANYPGEWWHFAYGDSLWAAYRYKSFAIYGPINPPAI